MICIDSGIISNILTLELSQWDNLEEILEPFKEYEIENLQDLYICPGIVDLNCSLGYDISIILESKSAGRESIEFLSEEDKYRIGSGSAAAGGVTTVIESPSVYNREMQDLVSFQRKLIKLKDIKLYCDVGFLGSLTPSNIMEAEAMAEEGVLGFKCFMIPPSAEYEYFDKDLIWLAMRETAFLHKPLFIHSEVTSDRYIYMNSPFRIERVESRQFNPKPMITMFPGAFPEDLSPVSDEECSPKASANFTSSSIPHLDILKQEKTLERKLKISSSTIEKLVSAEIVSYSKSGSTIFKYEDEETPISIMTQDSFSSMSSYESETTTRMRARSDSSLRITRRPPKITCCIQKHLFVETNYQDILVGSPAIWEENCIKIIVKHLTRYPQCRAHICNLSSAQACFTLFKKKSENSELKLTSETASFYLYYSDDQIKLGETFFKVHPPIREPVNQQLLKEILKLNKIDAVSSYHRPINPTLKFLNPGDFQRAVSGINSIGFNLQSVWAALEGEPSTVIPHMFKYLSYNPAKIIGLDQSKGSIAVGKHADIVVWNPFKKCKFTNSMHIYPETNPFLKESMKGKVYRTYVRGNLTYCNQQLVEASGSLLLYKD